jgi:hypothetical protein
VERLAVGEPIKLNTFFDADKAEKVRRFQRMQPACTSSVFYLGYISCGANTSNKAFDQLKLGFS